MRVTNLRSLVCCVMILCFPAATFAAETNAALLSAAGSASLNGSAVPRNSAIFPGDLIQTKTDSAAHVNQTGSLITIGADSEVKYEGDSILLQHGSVAVSSSTRMAARAGGVVVAPASDQWTQFAMTSSDGTVQVTARTGDVSINDGQETTTLPQGQQATVDDTEKKKKKRRKAAGAIPASGGPWLNSPWVVWGGVGVVGGVVLWVLLQGDDPMSDDTPSAQAVR
jgi:hypothetical protein